eukprot:TRINITY_DN96_c0_g2_i1.p1 TRINITY_DN96_c0_g2~~TRINITY_DN96_c0_g2_i1.p1  ORF type:complete len:137 (-),score=18.63 TRINITY_DN96_c0_g2_i1:643-1053(-)
MKQWYQRRVREGGKLSSKERKGSRDLTLRHPRYQEIVHIVLMGPAGVGKNSLAHTFLYGFYVPCCMTVIEDRYTVTGMLAPVQILVTAGQKPFVAMRQLYMRNGSGFILTFSITSHKSFEDLKPILNGIMSHKEMS